MKLLSSTYQPIPISSPSSSSSSSLSPQEHLQQFPKHNKLMALTDKNPYITPFLLSFSLIILHFASLLSHAADTLTQSQSLIQNRTLISSNQNFELGFFTPKNSTFRYVGIWYYNIQEQSVIWVANRNNPISNGSGTLRIGNDGNLIVLDENNNSIWSTNASISSDSTKLTLTNTGNLVISSVNDSSKHYWTSFEKPTDTYLPGMTARVNSETGENRIFTSWKSEIDPQEGNYSLGIDPRGSPQIVIWEGGNRIWRSGHWDSQKFTGIPGMSANLLYGFRLSPPDDEHNRFFTYTPLNNSDKLRYRIRWDGKEEMLMMEGGESTWRVMQSQPEKECDEYNKCGKFGICSESESPRCRCMNGFEPKDWDQWNRGNWSGGCERKTELLCEKRENNSSGLDEIEDGFDEVKNLKLPDFVDLFAVDSMVGSCKEKCLMNCSCTGYADVVGIGCMIWDGDLIDVQRYESGGYLMHVRLATSDLGGKTQVSTTLVIIITVTGTVFLATLIWLLWKFKGKLKVINSSSSIPCWKGSETPVLDRKNSQEFPSDLSQSIDLGIEGNQAHGSDRPELPFFNFNSVAAATDNFSHQNKLGQGGFGPVYKGKLAGGQEIAVKRLSGRSGQGSDEFKNEITLIGKLQHRNLVRLLGYCIQGQEKMLLYEYMTNKSLDFFLFEPDKKALLDWRKRFAIIEGIARGLLYLHRDSRLRVIHRDLKASNILLDEEMNPKISDFGMARIFGGNQSEANTMRVVGTYGYMAPEYAMEGLFSMKSDVYSFGILLLEIICGRRNTSFRMSDQLSLIGYAWQLWSEGKAMELLDPSVKETCSENEVMKCIHLGMLCAQDSADSRPTMASVVLMLESDFTTFPPPRQPTFTSRRSSIDTDLVLSGHDVSSNAMSSTIVFGR